MDFFYKKKRLEEKINFWKLNKRFFSSFFAIFANNVDKSFFFDFEIKKIKFLPIKNYLNIQFNLLRRLRLYGFVLFSEFLRFRDLPPLRRRSATLDVFLLEAYLSLNSPSVPFSILLKCKIQKKNIKSKKREIKVRHF